MKHIQSHFRFTTNQRYGICLLLVLIVVFQCLYFFVDRPSTALTENTLALVEFQKEIDSLKHVEIEKRKPKIYPFNPNYITDYKGYTLGMTTKEIDKLHAFRRQNKWVNSAKEFQNVTQVSDSLLSRIAPFFKFPDWVTHPKPKQKYIYTNQPKSFAQKIDLNTATASQLQRINGIGKKLSERIIKFRKKFPGGFIADIQLLDVFGLSPEVIEHITQQFTVKTPRNIIKYNLNTVTLEALVTIQHIDYEVAHEIIDQRTLREGFKSFDELTKVKGFPIDKIEIIKLYLML